MVRSGSGAVRAYTVGDGDSLTRQITSSASGSANSTAFGVIDISEVVLKLLIRAAGNNPGN